MVPSISGRALDVSRKKTLSRSGRYFGWLCMSCRQPVTHRRQHTAGRRQSVRLAGPRRLRLDLIDLSCSEALEKCARLLEIEFRVVGFDRQEQSVLARMFGEPSHV